ncbi:MAG: class I SAM-dependent methyltransferase [Pirellula sp.]
MACHITGWDISPVAIQEAQLRLQLRSTSQASSSSGEISGQSIQFQQANVFEEIAEPLATSNAREAPFDVVYSCLFLHHFTEEQAVERMLLMRGNEVSRFAT